MMKKKWIINLSGERGIGFCKLGNHQCQYQPSNYTDEAKRPLIEFYCNHCGYYVVSGYDFEHLLAMDPEKRWKAACLCREMFLQGRKWYRVSIKDDDILIENVSVEKRFPEKFTEKANRALLNLYNYLETPLEKIDTSPYVFFSKEQMQDILEYLRAVGYAKKDDAVTWTLTAGGWQAAERMQSRNVLSNTAFIAMWFDTETELIRNCIKKAILLAGYDPVIIDEDHHCDFIMDRVLNRIDEARFMIADFTSLPEYPRKENQKPRYGVRGGVYFEAGYARGKGIPVIVTCRNDENSRDRIHFDIQQLNTIFWDAKEDGTLETGKYALTEYLVERIIATVGPGKNQQMRI